MPRAKDPLFSSVGSDMGKGLPVCHKDRSAGGRRSVVYGPVLAESSTGSDIDETLFFGGAGLHTFSARSLAVLQDPIENDLVKVEVEVEVEGLGRRWVSSDFEKNSVAISLWSFYEVGESYRLGFQLDKALETTCCRN